MKIVFVKTKNLMISIVFIILRHVQIHFGQRKLFIDNFHYWPINTYEIPHPMRKTHRFLKFTSSHRGRETQLHPISKPNKLQHCCTGLVRRSHRAAGSALRQHVLRGVCEANAGPYSRSRSGDVGRLGCRPHVVLGCQHVRVEGTENWTVQQARPPPGTGPEMPGLQHSQSKADIMGESESQY